MAAKAKKRKAAPPPRKRSVPDWVGYLFLVTALAVHLLLVYQFNFTQDDAFITFRYAANYLDGHGLVYNVGERVEGYTNFLWTILMILGGRLGLDYIWFSKVLGTLFGVGTIVVLFFMGRTSLSELSRGRRIIMSGLSCLVVGLVYSYAYWTVAGLETAAFTFMVVTALYFYMRQSGLTIPALVLATLLRPEGGLVFCFVVLYELISNKSLTRYALTIFAVYAVFLLPFAAFKMAYYGSLFPNPFYAKTSFNMEQLMNGVEYTGEFFWHYLAAGIFVIPALVLFRKMSRPLKMTMIFLLVYTVYIALIGGDVLKVHRFFLPLFPLYALVAVAGLYGLFKNKAVSILAIAVLLGWQLYVPREHVTTFHRREQGLAVKMILLMNNLVTYDQSDFSVAASTIGMLGYKLLGHDVIDMLGLTDSTIARHPEPPIEGLETTWKETSYNSAYLLSRQPDYIIFSTGIKPSAPAERALFLYSDFLNHYRTIGYFLGTKMHSVFRRFGAIEGIPVRDVSVEFVQNFNKAINLVGENKANNIEALATLDLALKYSPQPVSPYVYYYMSEANRKLGNLQSSYNCLKQAAAVDTLAYEVYKDLYFYEYRMGNYATAAEYRTRVAGLVPWYLPRLDSLVTGLNQ